MKRLCNLTIMSKLLLAFASMIAIIAGVRAATYLKLRVIEESSGWTKHTDQVMETAQAIMASWSTRRPGCAATLSAATACSWNPIKPVASPMNGFCPHQAACL